MWLATTSSEPTKLRYQDQVRADLPDSEMPDPPLEYCELPRKGISDANGDLKRGILSSIFDKVRSKDESGKKSVDCLPFGKERSEDQRKSQPLLDNLLLDCTGGRAREDSADSIVQKPYEPPALGKSSRITPVGGGGEEQTASSHQSQLTSGLETDAVEVLSVIRYNKNKIGSSLTPSTMRSHSGSETASVVSQHCLACTDGTECEHLSYLRRSSAPEIDQEWEGEGEEGGRGRREIFTRSLGRTRRPGGESARSSDGESQDLQRARAHLKETLEGKIEKMKKMEAEKHHSQSETKAVVHRAEGQHVPSGKTLDSEAIKQYQNIKQNTAVPTSKQQRYSGVFDTSKSAKLERERQRDHQPPPSLYKQTSFDNLNLTRSSEPTTLPRERNEGEQIKKSFHTFWQLQLIFCLL